MFWEIERLFQSGSFSKFMMLLSHGVNLRILRSKNHRGSEGFKINKIDYAVVGLINKSAIHSSK